MWKFFKNLMKFSKNNLSPLKIGIENLNSDLKMLKLCSTKIKLL